jgi:signal transduction histidine kinase
MRSEPVSVLLVEDNADDAALVRRALSKAQQRFDVFWVGRLSEALERLEVHTFDVALVDLSLPDSCGLDTVVRIRERKPDVPIILLTATSSEEIATKALDQGAQDFLVKDRLLDSGRTEILERSIRYAIHRQKSSEVQRLLRQIEASHELLKSKNRRLARLCKTAERFVDNVSHEFRTPLTVIKEYTSLLLCGLVGEVNEQQTQFLNVVENRADDLNRMVDDMLDVSKLDAGLLIMSRTSCSVADIIESVRLSVERKAQARGIALAIRIDVPLPSVYCDPEKVGRVLINLAVNAIKFCGEGGHVSIWACEDLSARQVAIHVKDDGQGIDPEHMNKIFGRFKQLSTDARQSTQGFGLGLSIAKELVDLSFGQLTVESELRRGSTFSFTLPIDDPLEVLNRYLRRLAQLRNGTFKVSLVSATLPSSGDARLCEDVEAFLHHLLRADDLLFRFDPSRWVIVLATGGAGVERFRQRTHEALESTNRNRPSGELPSLNIANEGSWMARGANHELVTRFAALMHREIEADTS